MEKERSLYESLRWYKDRVRENNNKSLQLTSITDFVDNLENCTQKADVLEALKKLQDELEVDYLDFTEDAINDFKALIANCRETPVITGNGYVIHVYPDAVVVIEDFSRTAYWISEDRDLLFTDLSVSLEIWLENQNPIKEWYGLKMPF